MNGDLVSAIEYFDQKLYKEREHQWGHVPYAVEVRIGSGKADCWHESKITEDELFRAGGWNFTSAPMIKHVYQLPVDWMTKFHALSMRAGTLILDLEEVRDFKGIKICKALIPLFGMAFSLQVSRPLSFVVEFGGFYASDLSEIEAIKECLWKYHEILGMDRKEFKEMIRGFLADY